MRVIVIGGLGNFGARICRRLSEEPGFTVIATSRHRANGPGAASDRAAGPSGACGPAVLDLNSPHFFAELQALAPDLVIHCAGPFQGQDYRVALAALACGADYIDIADGREFVMGFADAVGPAARAAGRVAVTGASTLPALSSAVVEHLHQRVVRMEEIDIVIAPGQRAPRGVATMAAVLGYAGRPFHWWQRGAWRTVHGWQELERVHFSFGSRHAAACDVPDLAVLPARYPGLQTVTFRAALEISLQHHALWFIAACRRLGLPFPVGRWAAPLNRLSALFDRFGSDTGGMTVRVTGADARDQPICMTWELVAESNHGPEIPCMAACLLAVRLARGDRPPGGAQTCVGMLGLSDFEREFARWSISTQSCLR